MKKLQKEQLRLVGSAGSLADLLEMIRTRMYWTIEAVRPSEQFIVGRKPVFDICAPFGLHQNVCIVKDARRYKLYIISELAKTKNYYYSTADGAMFDTPKECRAYIRHIMREDNFAAGVLKRSMWQYKKEYYDDRKPVYFASFGTHAHKLVIPQI